MHNAILSTCIVYDGSIPETIFFPSSFPPLEGQNKLSYRAITMTGQDGFKLFHVISEY